MGNMGAFWLDSLQHAERLADVHVHDDYVVRFRLRLHIYALLKDFAGNHLLCEIVYN